MFTFKLKKRPFKGLFLFPLLLFALFSEKGYTPKISAIEFQGNTKTLDYIIKREIQHPLYAPLDSIRADEDRNRLENLGIFSEVAWRAVPLEDGTAILTFTITESIQKTPPGALPIYGEDTGWSLAGGWVITNFRGRNQSLGFNGSFGGIDTYGIFFSDPWIFGNHVSFSFGLGRSLFKHKFLDRDIDDSWFQINFGKWFGDHIKTSVGFELESKLYTNEKDSSEYFYFAPQTSLKYDTRDIYWNPGKGVLFSHFIHHTAGIDPKSLWTTFWKQSYSLFLTLNNDDKKLVLALNGTVNRKWGQKEKFWLNYFGSSLTVRGWPLPDSRLYYSEEEAFRFGHESVHASMELRQEIIPKYATSLGAELGLVLVAFADAGVIADNWNTLNDQLSMYGTGLGIRIPFPMVDVFRIDYGWGYRNGQWNSGALHWGIGQKF